MSRLLALVFCCFGLHALPHGARALVLSPDAFAPYIQRFNRTEDENWTNAIPNAQSWEWLKANIPLFECPDKEIEETYYFRWWSYRKHLVQTTNGFVLTEFLRPIGHAGVFNTISCATGHHVAEGRWLRDGRYLDDYIQFWLRGNQDQPQPHFHKYSSWFAAAVYERYLANNERGFVTGLLDGLVKDYAAWENERQLTNGLFWQYDVRDGMEESISGSRTEKNMRPTINSYMYGNAKAIAAIAGLVGKKDLAREFESKAASLKQLSEQLLWNSADNFFEVRRPNGQFSSVREQIGFLPWRFNLPGSGFESAWSQLMDPEGFRASYGIATAERRHPHFRSHGCCRCEWDGPVWPFATSQTLDALANLLRNYRQTLVTKKDYFQVFLQYARSHQIENRPYIGEYLDEITGQWLKGRQERSRYYNHSTFADLVITGIAGLVPKSSDTVEVSPMADADVWDWFCADSIPYHGRTLTILWDRDGKHYGQGSGFRVLADGKVLTQAAQLQNLTGKLK